MIRSGSALTRRIFGVAFFLVVGLFIWFTISIYNKSFSDVVKVDMITDSVGNALPQYADVKMRGVLVGEVRSAEPEGGKVKSVLALDPGEVAEIPSNVTARLLPKTLFGERYVDLVVPAEPTSEPIAAGDTIVQDVSGNAVEIGKLLDSVLPLLEAVPPQDLSVTLSALAQALEGRGEQLGITIDRLETIFREVNTELPALQSAIRDFATFTETYADAAPQLVNALNNLRTTNATIVQRRPQVDVLIASLATTAPSVTDFLAANRDNIVSIAADSEEALSLLATYSPSFPCALHNFAQLLPRVDKLMGVGTPYRGPHVTIELTNPRGRYLPNQDEPRMLDTRGPWCAPEPPLGVDPGQYPGGSINDGSYQPPTRDPGLDPTFYPIPQFSAMPAMPATSVGSPLERASLSSVYGVASGLAPQDIPEWTTAIGAPALRGKEVRVR